MSARRPTHGPRRPSVTERGRRSRPPPARTPAGPAAILPSAIAAVVVALVIGLAAHAAASRSAHRRRRQRCSTTSTTGSSRTSDTSPLFLYFLNPISNAAQLSVRRRPVPASALTWLGVVTAAAAIARSGGRAGGSRSPPALRLPRLGLLGLWEPTMETLALMVVSRSSLALLIGIPLGIWAGRRPTASSGCCARSWTPCRSCRRSRTCCRWCCSSASACPPAADRDRHLRGPADGPAHRARPARRAARRRWRSALARRDAAAAPADRSQLPLARSAILLGLNQTIMMALSWSSSPPSVGAGGLGQVVLTACSDLDVGAALAAGIPIVLLAIGLDRTTAAWGDARSDAARTADVRVSDVSSPGGRRSRGVARSSPSRSASVARSAPAGLPGVWTVSIDDPVERASSTGSSARSAA